AKRLGLRLVVMPHHLEGLQIIVDERQGVRPTAEIIDGHIEPPVETLEGIENEKGRVARLFGEALRGRVGMEMLRLEVEGSGGSLELRLVDRRGELARSQIVVPVPHLPLAFAR